MTTFLIDEQFAYADTAALLAALPDPTLFDQARTFNYEGATIDESVQIGGHHSLSAHALASVLMMYKRFAQAQSPAAYWMKWSQVIPPSFLGAWEAAMDAPYTTPAKQPALTVVASWSDDFDYNQSVVPIFIITGGATPVVEFRIYSYVDGQTMLTGEVIHQTIPLATFRDGLRHEYAMLTEMKYSPVTQSNALRVRCFHKGPSDGGWTLMTELAKADTDGLGPIAAFSFFGWQITLGNAADLNDLVGDGAFESSLANYGELQLADALLNPDPYGVGVTADHHSSTSDPVAFTLAAMRITDAGVPAEITFRTAMNAAGQDVSGAPFILNTRFVVEDPVIAFVGGVAGGTVTPIIDGVVSPIVRIRPTQDRGNVPELFYGEPSPFTLTISGQPMPGIDALTGSTTITATGFALDPNSLLAPNGPVTPELFPNVPSNVLYANLLNYINRAFSDPRLTSEKDPTKYPSMARALTLYFVFWDVYIRMNAQPKTLTVSEKGGHGYDMQQINNMRALAEGYLAEFAGLMTVIPSAKQSGLNASVRNRFRF